MPKIESIKTSINNLPKFNKFNEFFNGSNISSK